MLGRAELDCPAGTIVLWTRGPAFVALGFADRWDRLARGFTRRFGAPPAKPALADGEAVRRLEAYLAGELDALDDVVVDPGGTPFQRAVWAGLRRIPPGKVLAYGELARRLGRPDAVRAVAAANAPNPISIAIPCHRVIAADGSLHGYAAGLERKRWLLDHEGAASGAGRAD